MTKINISIVLIVLLNSSLSMAQYKYEPTAANPYGLPNPKAPPEIKDFEPLIGKCDCLSYRGDSKGNWLPPVKMTWEFKYIMNGMAVQDQTLKEDGAHSGSIRQFNADSSKWYVHYYSSTYPTPKLRAWEGNRKDDAIILYSPQLSPNGLKGFYKISFYNINENGFDWLGAWVNEDESIKFPTWKINCRKNNGQMDKPKNMEKQNILGLRTAAYKVGDINEAKKWYEMVFNVKPYFDEPFYVGFNIGGYELGLQPEDNPTKDKRESVLTYWGVDEIEKVYHHFIRSGAIEHEKPHSVGGPIMIASVKDPWGNIIGLIYNPEFKLKE